MNVLIFVNGGILKFSDVKDIHELLFEWLSYKEPFMASGVIKLF